MNCPPGPPGLGFSVPAIVPNISRLGNRFLICRVPCPQWKKAAVYGWSFRFSMLSLCVILSALAYERVVWSLRHRRWKPMTRNWTWWAVRSLAECSALRVDVTRTARSQSPQSSACVLSDYAGLLSHQTTPGPTGLRHARMRRIRRSISSERSAFSWITPRR